jgi:hypothetical protein
MGKLQFSVNEEDGIVVDVCLDQVTQADDIEKQICV